MGDLPVCDESIASKAAHADRAGGAGMPGPYGRGEACLARWPEREYAIMTAQRHA